MKWSVERRQICELRGQGLHKMDDNLTWIEAMRRELRRYRDDHDESVLTLQEVYGFSERRLSAQFPDNDNVRAKIRQQLQRLRDRDEVEFLDDAGAYRITIESE